MKYEQYFDGVLMREGLIEVDQRLEISSVKTLLEVAPGVWLVLTNSEWGSLRFVDEDGLAKVRAALECERKDPNGVYE